MEASNLYLLIGGALVLLSILATALSARFGVPVLLIFLTLGMLAGEDGLGHIRFHDVHLAYLIGNLALALILLDGGLRTRIATFRAGLRPALSLATVGVALTALLTGGFIAWAFGIDLRYGLLLGAIVSSTDAAAVFAALSQTGVSLNRRVGATLEIESGANDPMALFLVATLAGVIARGEDIAPLMLLAELARQFGIGLILGVPLAHVTGLALMRLSLIEGLQSLLLTSAGVATFAIINAAGGSGFLGIYLFGVLIGNTRARCVAGLLPVMGGYAWLSQAGMFLVLGLLVTPSALIDRMGIAVSTALFLILVARPVAVAVALWPFRFPLREVSYISWIGLRGAVPIVLSLFPVMASLPGGQPLFEITFVVVLTSLLIQGTTVASTARWLRVRAPRQPQPFDRKRLALERVDDFELFHFRVEAHAHASGRTVALPQTLPETRCVAVERNRELFFPDAEFELREGDQVFLIAPATTLPDLARLFAGEVRRDSLSQRAFFGDFSLEADTTVADLAEVYGLPVAAGEPRLTLAQLLRRRLARTPVEGDSVVVGALCLTVRELGPAGEIRKVGMKLR